MRKRIYTVLFLLTAQFNATWADEEKEIDIRTTGYFMWDLGYLNETQDLQGRTWKNEIIGGFLGGLHLAAKPSERMYLVVNPEFQGAYMLPRRPGIAGGEGDQKIQWGAYIQEAKTVYTIGDLKEPIMRIGMGLMEYKYNANARIFGEYLFRSIIYPTIINTSFNYPKANIFGLHLENNLGTSFQQNFFALGEIDHYPFFDLSLAYTAEYSWRKMVNVGAGVNFRSVVPIRPSLTEPVVVRGEGIIDNTYKWTPLILQPLEINTRDPQGNPVKKFIQITQATDVNGAAVDSVWIFESNDATNMGTPKTTRPIKRKGGRIGMGGLIGGGIGNPSGEINNPAMLYLTPEDGIGKLYPEVVAAGGENTVYSFAGTILMARASVNPLGFMEQNPLGNGALTVYTEGAVLGWKNYDGYYENRSERIPMMLGFGLPHFGFLDGLALEFEYFKSKHIPVYEYRYKRNVPHPQVEKAGLLVAEWKDPERQKKDDLKWVISAKKSFPGLTFAVQAGTDHSKYLDESHRKIIDNLTRPSHWYFQLRVIGGVY